MGTLVKYAPLLRALGAIFLLTRKNKLVKGVGGVWLGREIYVFVRAPKPQGKVIPAPPQLNFPVVTAGPDSAGTYASSVAGMLDYLD